MFPNGDSGWNINIRNYDPDTNIDAHPVQDPQDGNKAEISIMQYYSSRLMLRPSTSPNVNKREQVGIHSFGKLFHQYVVDMYAKMEQQRLNFIRFNQKSLRAELYNGLADAIHLGDNDMSEVGKKVILPSSFIGGPRFMAQLYQDAMNLVRRFGKPDLFITFTCNPAWSEIANELLVNQKPSDRPDLCARVFNLKLRALLDDVVKNSVFGKVVAYCYSIEFQKRGLPHCHMLFILDERDKPRTVQAINGIVSAEIPDPATHPLAHASVTANMVHGPCGMLNPDAVCMKNGRCSKNYPFDFCEDTLLADDDNGGTDLTYRRRVMPERTILRNNGRTTVDNRWIVPHNLYLSAKFDAHINVEVCTHVSSVKYVYKYIFKGHDRAQVHMGNNEHPDEIKNFLDARYVSAAEACWRLFSFPMHKEYPACQRLDVHLPGDRMVYFDEDDHPQDVLNRPMADSTLTAWFKYNLNNPDDEEAKTTLYTNFCERNQDLVSPKDIEKFHLRILLLHVPGATSFQDLRTFEGQVHNSFRAAARTRGLLGDDNEWSAAMTEAALSQHPSALRQLFCILVAFSGVSDPYQLWLLHRDSMAEDYLYRYQQSPANIDEPLNQISDEMYGHCFLDPNDILADHRYDLKSMKGFGDVFPTADTRNNGNHSNHFNTYERLSALLYVQSLDANDPDL
ncbi:hypothetical protein [Parasitella parasitica]|uniref:Helitron helicase-like domain-containing protein n=1 Tax=Parasitella parasitica TaxID=35722 RepID=A0A0B7N549_9FUNG|nr:hypothetical protein [Parasitella parasitica]